MIKYLIALLIPVLFSLNAFSQVLIDPSGNAGVGTSTPTTKLDVDGNLRVRSLNQNNSADSIVVVTGNGTFEYRSAATLGGGGGTCTYNIGDFAFGGLIFYLDGSGCHGLIADTVNLGVYQWDTGGSLNTYAFADWAIGGRTNTNRMITVYGAANVPASNACQNSTAQGFSDWYLPSKIELNMMFVNLHLQGLGSFGFGTYWHSTEVSSSIAGIQEFFDGFQDTGNKTLNCNVRAIRSF